MKLLARKTVEEYQYDSAKEAVEHTNEMKRQGWNVEPTKNPFTPYFRSYSKRQRKGVFL